MNGIVKVILAVIVCAAMILGLCMLVFGTGFLGVEYTKTVGIAQSNADREVFKASKTYNESMAQDLSKYMLQYQQATDDTSKKAIVDYIVHNYADFDASKLQNDQVKNFLNECMNGELSK